MDVGGSSEPPLATIHLPEPQSSEDRTPPRQWVGTELAESLHCRKCGYNLRGLRAEGRCPECGMDIWSTVLATIDPTATRMPTLRNPRAVGNAVLALAISIFGGALLMAADSVVRLIENRATSSGNDLMSLLLLANWFLTPLLAATGAWAIWMLMPPRGREPYFPVWIDLWRIVIGFIGWRIVAFFWFDFPRLRVTMVLATAMFATIGLMGLRGVFGIIGRRSREYRRSSSGRQSLELIIAAILAHAAAALFYYLTGYLWFPGEWRGDVRTITTTVMWISSLMVLIGLAYLVMNAIWIRKALTSPAPRINEVLRTNQPQSKWVADRE